ncbi:MAG: Glu-tRNA(Gln) amidotransferase subunit GatE [Candidatus Aenigmatarchaeota archaeon]
MVLDYAKLGLKCGIEIHQQLETAHKLFCSCPARFSSAQPSVCLERKMRVVAGETGKVDAAASHEAGLGKTFRYNVYSGEDCLVEADCEPPRSPDAEALKAALTVAVMLGCDVTDEIHVMRKTVLDGSNTGGFQRTMVVGLLGSLKSGGGSGANESACLRCGGSVGIEGVCLEEDSAQIIEKGSESVVYGLDRLGIPLVEIGTAADIRTPEQAREVAEKIGMLLRSTGKAKRGIGTIRQDVNVSIAGGARVEIKGAQELRLIPKYVENEVARQHAILLIGKELSRRKAPPATSQVRDVTAFFSKSQNRIMKGSECYAIIIKGFAGMLGRKITETRTLGNEIASYAKVRAGIKGFIHSDENLEKYGLDKEFLAVGRELSAKEGDTLIIMAAGKALAQATAGAIEERINQFMRGVPMEVRRALENGDTEYLRPMPGSARMYPETDVPAVAVTKEELSRIKKNLPETWDKKIVRLEKSYGISSDMSGQLVRGGCDFIFESLARKFDPRLVSSVLTSAFREMEREGLDTGRISEERLSEVFSMVSEGLVAKEALPEILRKVSQSPEKSAREISGASRGMGEEELCALVRKVISEKKEQLSNPRRESVLMGLVMKEARGRVDGKKVMEALRKELKKH